jgi:hypothetical protein
MQNLTENQKQLVKLIKRSNGLKTSDLAKLLGEFVAIEPEYIEDYFIFSTLFRVCVLISKNKQREEDFINLIIHGGDGSVGSGIRLNFGLTNDTETVEYFYRLIASCVSYIRNTKVEYLGDY